MPELAPKRWFATTPEWQQAVAAWRGIRDAPAPENRARSEGIRVLENHFLERYVATSHWIMPAVWFVPVIAVCLWSAGAHHGLSGSAIAVGLVVGLAGWTLVEYVLHRFVFHFPAGDVGWLRTVMFAMHGYHHEFPNDPHRLVAPPILSWPIGAALGLGYWAAFGSYWQPLFAGTLCGYLAYDWMHYYTHHAVPRSRFGRFMRRFHFEHHYRDASAQFGLSSPIWDAVFGSWERRQPREAGSVRRS